jgi:hypothetical protein
MVTCCCWCYINRKAALEHEGGELLLLWCSSVCAAATNSKLVQLCTASVQLCLHVTIFCLCVPLF